MKSINQYLNDKLVLETMRDIYTHKMITINKIDGGGHIWLTRKNAKSHAGNAFIDLLAGSSLVATEGYVMSQMYGIGPKIFKPTALQFQMMEHITLNVPCSDYNQPFPTMIFEIPENQYKADYIGSRFDLGKHKPIFMVLHYAAHVKTLFGLLMFDSEQSAKIIIRLNLTEEIEEALQLTFSGLGQIYKENEVRLSESEDQVHEAIIRTAINYCLLINEKGMKNKGPYNPNHYKRLQKHANGDVNPAKAKEALRLHPIVYTIEQDIELFKVSKEPLINDPNYSGREQSPHWRRGYYRQQPYGPNNSLRKRKFIPHVFVNMRKFNGEMINTKATYHEK